MLAPIHAALAVLALLLGALQFMLHKGTRLHRRLGWVWLAAMAATALSSFGLTSLTGHFSAVHLLSLWVLYCLYAAVRHIRRGNVVAHRNFIVGAWLGALGAGIAAVATPGRLLHHWLQTFTV
ncbi:Uncharacterized membrane protein [Andreprevotia lacus DSM 23236]|jgi:uncharacterized membrane protein|uniref:Uncharacterized membrane protein n=1 Tax=Andreprevotia lacus DSM 23236 TaxID=1121001 RepID=A0A1W1XTY5_9NEIS|nr:DUF2306 domain-containing protein [Andreprevotia lacus]SMC27324.1 Uncharacterized membrane protein [Andreprevotia lacus DSM 23236]